MSTDYGLNQKVRVPEKPASFDAVVIASVGPNLVARFDRASVQQMLADLARLRAVERAAREYHTVIGNRHHGRMPDEVQAAHDALRAALEAK